MTAFHRVTRALVLALSCTPFAVSAQAVLWQTDYAMAPASGANPYTVPYDLRLDSAGNVFLVGSYVGAATVSLGNDEFITARFSAADGRLQWASPFSGGPYSDRPSDFGVDANGDVVVAGKAQPTSGASDMAILKYAGASGQLRWERVYHNAAATLDRVYAVASDGAGNVYVTGDGSSPSSAAQSIITKYDGATGATLWQLVGPTISTASFLRLDARGNPVVAISYYSSPPIARIAKLNAATGSTSWQFDITTEIHNRGVHMDAAGNVFVIACTVDTFPGALRIIKLNGGSGQVIWDKTPSSCPEQDAFVHSSLDPAGDIVLAASYNQAGVVPGTSFPASDFVTKKISGADGTLLWSRIRHFGDGSPSPLNALAVDPYGNVFVAGNTSVSSNSQGVMEVLEYGPDGSSLWNYSASAGDASASLSPVALAASSDALYVAARMSLGGTGYGSVARLIKLDAGSGKADTTSYQGAWWRSPPGSESGWGLNVVHQGDILFMTWFTYGADGKPTWFFASDMGKQSSGTYSGTLYRATGPAWSAAVFDPASVHLDIVGSATLAFTGPDSGTFSYTVNGAAASKPITRMVFKQQPACSLGGARGASNFDGLWYRPAESGWGIDVAQEDDTLFATWFTYDESGAPTWFVASSMMPLPSAPHYQGSLYRTTGPAFDAVPWDPAHVQRTAAGTLAFDFSSPTASSLTATVDGKPVAKSISLMSFAAPSTTCK